MIMADTQVTTGMQKDSEWNGYGITEHYDGDKFEGLFENGKLNRLGKYTWADGRSYVGNWKDDKWLGHGIYR